MLVAALMVGTATVNAQIWGGQLILRGGFAANNFKGDNTRGIDMLPGYNFSLDFNKNFYKGAYWNTGVMFGTRGFDVNHSDVPGIAGYIVQPGDSLWMIAKKFHTTISHIISANELADEEIKAGQRLLLVKEVARG